MALAGHDITDAYSFVFSDSRGGLPFLATAYHWDGGFNKNVLMHMIKDFGINPRAVHNYLDERMIGRIKIMCWVALRWAELVEGWSGASVYS